MSTCHDTSDLSDGSDAGGGVNERAPELRGVVMYESKPAKAGSTRGRVGGDVTHESELQTGYAPLAAEIVSTTCCARTIRRVKREGRPRLALT
jgi:hypothetical protein